jgi:ADP-heptose:LPS heptosyltransferase
MNRKPRFDLMTRVNEALISISTIYLDKVIGILQVICNISDEDLDRIAEELRKQINTKIDTIERLKQIIALIKMAS